MKAGKRTKSNSVAAIIRDKINKRKQLDVEKQRAWIEGLMGVHKNAYR